MKVELFPFQQKAVKNLRMFAAISKASYPVTSVPQVISFTAPTGAGKTIMTAAFVKSVYARIKSAALEKNFYFNADGVNHSQLIKF